MAKDPAFLFYPNDWIGGTMGMTFEQKGAYMELLMMQFNLGHMTSDMIGQEVGPIWDKIKHKFEKDGEGLYFNVRLEIEIEKRKTFVASRNNNLSGKNQYSKDTNKSGHKGGHKTSRMENENEDINENTNEYGIAVEKWFSFFEKVNAFKPSFNGMDGKKIKSILSKLSAKGNAIELFSAILDNHEKISDAWLKKNMIDLKIFDSKLDLILADLKKSYDNGQDRKKRYDSYS